MRKASVFDLAVSATNVASLAVEDRSLVASREANREATVTLFAQMHKEKVVIGTYGKCVGATSFMDTLTAKGFAKGSAKNYLSTFRQSVASGKFNGWNPSRDAAKGKGKGKGGRAKGEFDGLFVKAFNHAKGESFINVCADVERLYKDDKVKTLYAGFVEWLRAAGYEVDAK